MTLLTRRRPWRTHWIAVLSCVTACSPKSLIDVTPPSSINIDPAVVKTAAGATQLYNATIGQTSRVMGATSNAYILWSGCLTDELTANGITPSAFRCGADADRRGENASNPFQGPYNGLHMMRVGALNARTALRLYAPDTPVALQGHLHALEGYSLVLLAELFCSGIPLSVYPLVGKPVFSHGFTTSELLERALVLFDSAMVSGADSSRVVNLARVGRGRALLGLGRLADAAAAVRDVPLGFVYGSEHGTGVNPNVLGNDPRVAQTVDAEGGYGLVWSSDPRPAFVTTPSVSSGMRYSAKYSRTAAGTLSPTTAVNDNPVRIADGVEARLIEAEAALAAGNATWLTTLNLLRATCIGTQGCAPVPGLTSALLPALVDPGTAAARVDLLMRERAMWLYLTGHRQGDLRRLARLYQRPVETLYPTGTYSPPAFPPLVPAPAGAEDQYGSAVVLKGDPGETALNPNYPGCFDLQP